MGIGAERAAMIELVARSLRWRPSSTLSDVESMETANEALSAIEGAGFVIVRRTLLMSPPMRGTPDGRRVGE